MNLKPFEGPVLDVLQGVVAGGLVALGIPSRVASIAGKSVPLVVRWAERAIVEGRDAEAELAALLDAADLVADEAERAKFGP